MQEVKKRLLALEGEFLHVYDKLEIPSKTTEMAKLEAEIAEPEIWKNVKVATEKHQELARLSDETQPWELLKTQIEDLKELIKLTDEDLKEEIEGQIISMENDFTKLRKTLRFQEKYDKIDAIIRITSGAGGAEAMDWAEMLERMYLRFIKKQGLRSACLERIIGEEAGIKTAVYEVTGAAKDFIGAGAFGVLKSENGVHRLVRLSPFNAQNLRQTSFALVEILPKITADTEVEIAEKDLRVDVYRSGGHGGQGVNTTDSAVRITHLPTNTVVTIQNERSQIQNREKAMEILKGKLVQMQLEQRAVSLSELQAGESASWGQQIRNYILHPYKLVKDTRTGFESKEPDKVLDGDLVGFIEAYLEFSLEKQK